MARRTPVAANRSSSSSRAKNSASRRDLPAPASPITLTSWAWPRCMRSNAASRQSIAASRPTSGAASPRSARPRAEASSARTPARRCTRIGCTLPRSASSTAGSKAKRCRTMACVASDTSTVPGSAAESRREAVFTVSPVTA